MSAPAPAGPASPNARPRSTAQVTHPKAPTPPRSRAGVHILSLGAGLVLIPTGLALLAGAYDGLSTALERSAQPTTAALAAVFAGTAILGIVALVPAGSALGPLVGGIVYGVAPGAGFLVAPTALEDATRSLAEPLLPLTGPGMRDGLLALGRSGSLAVLGLVLTLVAVAAHAARRSGRRGERSEAALRTGRPDAAAGAAGAPGAHSDIAPPTPPRSRRRAHLLTSVGAVVITPVALALVAAGGVALAARASGTPAGADLLGWPWLVGVALLASVVASAGWSASGLFVAATVFGVVPGAIGLLWPDRVEGGIGAALAWIGDVVHPDSEAGLVTMTALGVLLAWGVIGALGAIGCHGARRDGTRRERAEAADRRATA